MVIESTLGWCEVFCRRTTYERPGARVIEPCAYAECTMNSLRWDLIRWLGYVLRTFTAAPVYHLLFAYSIAVHGCGGALVLCTEYAIGASGVDHMIAFE